MQNKWLVLIVALSAVAVFIMTRDTSEAQAQNSAEALPQTWVIYTATYSYRDNDKTSDHHSQNTILLNTQTGETSILWINDAGDYEWQPLEHQHDVTIKN